MKYLYLLAFAYIAAVIWTQPIRFDERWIFDNAVKVSQGQLPYRDFVITYGPAPYIIYGVVFKVFGYSWLVTRVCATLVTAVFLSFLALALYFAAPGKVSRWLTLVMILFFWEYPLIYISTYTAIVPIILLLCLLLCDVIESDDTAIYISACTGAVYLFRLDTGVMVTFTTAGLLFMLGSARRFEQYLKHVALFGAVCVGIVLCYSSPGDIINTLAQTYGLAENYGSFNLNIHRWTHVVYKFPIFSPILICTLAAWSLFKKYDIEIMVTAVFTLMLYVPVLYSLDTPHAVPANLMSLVLAGMILNSERRSHAQ